MSLIKFKRNRLPWINDSIGNWLDTDSFFSDDFFIRDKDLPAMNIKENKDDFEVELAVPGFSKEDIAVTIENDMLHISAKNSNNAVQEDENYTRKEFSYNSFDRRLQLPNSIDQNKKVKAAYKDGVLTLNLLKKEESKEPPKKVIEIA